MRLANRRVYEDPAVIYRVGERTQCPHYDTGSSGLYAPRLRDAAHRSIGVVRERSPIVVGERGDEWVLDGRVCVAIGALTQAHLREGAPGMFLVLTIAPATEKY